MRDVFIVGCGDIGLRVASRWLQRGARVAALARTPERAAEFTATGIQPIRGDLDASESLALPPPDTLVYYLAPPPARGIVDARMHSFLNKLDAAHPPARVVYISTSGVYGDVNGAWVSEESPTHPTTDRSRRRLDAEQALLTWTKSLSVPVVILRVPGIYGPGRLPIEAVKSGRPILRESESLYTNRIHADDLADICVTAGEDRSPAGIYNVSDGRPGTMTQYFKAVADLIGVPHPPEVSLEEARRVLSAEMMSYLTESRRIDNRKMLRVLEVKLRYPDLKSGLAACR